MLLGACVLQFTPLPPLDKSSLLLSLSLVDYPDADLKLYLILPISMADRALADSRAQNL